MPGTRPFSAVCFDLDGTLIDSEPLHLRAELEMLRSLGVEKRAADHPRTFGMGIMPGMAAVSDHYWIVSQIDGVGSIA